MAEAKQVKGNIYKELVGDGSRGYRGRQIKYYYKDNPKEYILVNFGGMTSERDGADWKFSPGVGVRDSQLYGSSLKKVIGKDRAKELKEVALKDSGALKSKLRKNDSKGTEHETYKHLTGMIKKSSLPKEFKNKFGKPLEVLDTNFNKVSDGYGYYNDKNARYAPLFPKEINFRVPTGDGYKKSEIEDMNSFRRNAVIEDGGRKYNYYSVKSIDAAFKKWKPSYNDKMTPEYKFIINYLNENAFNMAKENLGDKEQNAIRANARTKNKGLRYSSAITENYFPY